MNYAVILAGGVGSRFWPFSRELEPKQFMRLVGKESLLQSTLNRLKGIVKPEHTFIITNNNYFYELLNQIKGFAIPEKNIILEPEGKNTAPAVGVCAKLISAIDKNANLIILPADHYIRDFPNFRKTIQNALEAAGKELLVTIGIKPLKPSTAYGYIKTGKLLQVPCLDGRQASLKAQVYKVEKFLEKPCQEKARKYAKDKHFYWNSGIFIWKAAVFLEEARKYLPVLHRQLSLIKSKKDIAKVWSKIKPISVDYGIMEHSKRIALIPADFFWTDLGSWDALAEVFPQDEKGNIFVADILNLESRRTCVFSKGNRLISTIGLRDLIIADTPDALLVCDRKSTQDVKRIVETLKSSHRREHRAHFTEKRPWGYFTILMDSLGFKIKLIEIEARRRLSLQCHRRRAEHWVVISGLAKVNIGNKTKFIKAGESLYIPTGVRHRLENSLKAPLKIVEVQTGDYLGEDDIERFEDDYRKECRPVA